MNKNLIVIIAVLAVISFLAACDQPTQSGGGEAKSSAENRDAASVNNSNPKANSTANSTSTEQKKEDAKPKEAAKCELAKAPEIEGFYLGMTVDEINAKIPGFRAAYDKEKTRQTEDRKKANFVLMTLASSFSDDEARKIEAFKDRNFIWHFLDEKLVALVVKRDDEMEISDIKGYVKKVADKHNLPSEGWVFDKEQGADLFCQGFKISATTNVQPGTGIMLTDSKAEAEMKKRGL